MDKNQNVVSSEVKNGITTFSLYGDVTPLSEKPVLDLYEKVSAEGVQKILLDFSKAKYINSGGIAIIISMVAEARKKNQKVGVCSLSDHFQKIFDMIGLTDYVEMYQTEEEALEAL